jgi:hypothetical protein
MTHRQEPKPTNKRDAEWAIIRLATELADYVCQRGGMKHITEVKLIEAVDDFRALTGR